MKGKGRKRNPLNSPYLLRTEQRLIRFCAKYKVRQNIEKIPIGNAKDFLITFILFYVISSN